MWFSELVNAIAHVPSKFFYSKPCFGFHHSFPEAFLTSIKINVLICFPQSFLLKINSRLPELQSVESLHENKISFSSVKKCSLKPSLSAGVQKTSHIF